MNHVGMITRGQRTMIRSARIAAARNSQIVVQIHGGIPRRIRGVPTKARGPSPRPAPRSTD
eukprot:4756564-Lingulodinium_polyedra.AAC.1